VNDAPKDTLTEELLGKVKDALGLPPGQRPDGTPRPSTENPPRETLTSDDAEGLPPHDDVGTGLRKI